MRILLFISEIFRKFPLLLVKSIILIFIVGFMDAAAVISLAPVVDVILHPDLENVSSITTIFTKMTRAIGLPVTFASMMTIFVMLNAVRTFFYISARHLILRIKYAVLRDLILGVFKDFFHTTWAFFAGSRQGNMLNALTRELQVIGDALGAMAVFMMSGIQVVLYTAVPLYISWKVASISFLSALGFALPFLMFGKISYRLGQANIAAAAKVTSFLQENLSSAKVVMGFANQDNQLSKLEKLFTAATRITLKSQTLDLAVPLAYHSMALFVVLIAFVAANKIGVPFSETTIILYSLMRVIPVVGQMAGQRMAFNNFFPSYEHLKQMRDQAIRLKQYSGTKEFQGLKRELVVKDLSFSYQGCGLVLDNVNLSVPKGKIIALVGESGSGKSTLVDLIMGFYEIKAGNILIDDVPIQQFDINSYRRKIGYVPQESVLFNMSVKDNLVWAKEDATEDELKEACRKANAHEFIEKLPQGYEMIVGDKGVCLSSGQVQRIALARAILRKPDLLILDEATSSLDSMAEKLVQQAIERIAKETTVIIVAHRLSTIINADYIYLLDKGRIVEQGTYEDLYRKNGIFRCMSELQALERSCQ